MAASYLSELRKSVSLLSLHQPEPRTGGAPWHPPRRRPTSSPSSSSSLSFEISSFGDLVDDDDHDDDGNLKKYRIRRELP